MDDRYSELIKLIDSALDDADLVVGNSSWMKHDKEPINSTVRLLQALKSELEKNPESVDERILKGIHDLGMASFKEFENTPLEESIVGVTASLRRLFPGYATLKPLGPEFGKGFPV